MESIKSLSCLLVLLAVSDLIESHTRNCFYNESRNHVEYVCDGDVGKRFNQKTNEVLYCHNYYSGINRANVTSVSFRNCFIIAMDTFNLWNFSGVRVLNLSHFGFEDLPDLLFKGNIHLERVTFSHNHLKELPALLFNNTPELVDVDFSYNQITHLNPLLFDNNHKLKTANFSFNAIKSLNGSIFLHLRELEILDLSDNQIEQIDSDLLANNTKLKILNLNNNLVKRMSCELLATLSKNYSLDIFTNTLGEIQTNCYRGEKHFELDIFISPKVTITRLQVAKDNLRWIFSETDFIKVHHLNLLNNRIKNTIEIFKGAYTNEHFIRQLNIIECLLLLLILIVVTVGVIFIVRLCERSLRSYIKSIVVFSVQQDLANDNHHQMVEIPPNC